MSMSTIDWMIWAIGESGAYRADIIAAGIAEGHNPSTLHHYLGSAACYGHVDPEFCKSQYGRPRARRTVYFNRRRKAYYTLSENGVSRLAYNKVEAEHESRVKAAKVEYNGGTMRDYTPECKIGPQLLEQLELYFGHANEDNASFNLTFSPEDAAYSYEDTYHLTITCEYAVEGEQLEGFKEAVFDVMDTKPEVTICCGEMPGQVCITYSAWVSEVQTWEVVETEPRHNNLDVGQY